MAMRALRFRERHEDGVIYALVWIDTTKTGVDLKPDPAWTRLYTYSPWERARLHPSRRGQTKADYVKDLVAITKASAQADLAEMTKQPEDDETVLEQEGKEL